MSEPVVETSAGRVRGATSGGVHVFRGIAYGAPTGGRQRFRPAVAPTPWGGVRDATSYGPTVPQVAMAAETGVKDR